MRNKKFITAVLVLSMMLMGAGYAAWTQDFTVTATVNTGDLDIGLSTTGAVVISTMIEDEQVVDDVYAEGKVVVGEQLEDGSTDLYSVLATLERMYPGAIADFDVTVKNTGTVGIKIDNIGTAVNVDSEFGEYTIEATVVDESGNEVVKNGNIAVGGTEIIHYTVTFVDGANDDSENLTDKVTVEIPVTYTQYNKY